MAVVQRVDEKGGPGGLISTDLSNFINVIPQPVLVLQQLDIVAWNRAAFSLVACADKAELSDIFEWPDDALTHDLELVLATGRQAVGEATLRVVPADKARQRTVRYVVSVLCPGREDRAALLVMHIYDMQSMQSENIRRDIEIAELSSEIHRLERAHEVQRHKRALFQRFFESAATGMAVVGLDGAFLEVNDRMCEICGYGHDELLRLTFQDITYPEDLEQDESLASRLAHGEIKDYTLAKRYVKKGGALVWVEITVSATLDVDGRPEVYTVVVRDISQERQLEATRNLLVGEMNHRVKNTLAVVQGIVKQTLETSTTPEQFAHALEGRLFSISRAYDLLNQSDWAPLSFRQIIKAKKTGPFSPYAARIGHDGDDAILTPQATVLVNLVLHELATNAIKYGALSNDRGVVAIVTRRAPSDGGADFSIRWVETGGPEVQSPTSKGFGKFMLLKGVQFGLNGVSDVRYSPEGVEYTLTFPVES